MRQRVADRPRPRQRAVGRADGRAVRRARRADARGACSASSTGSGARRGRTIVFVTHDIWEAILLADRVVTMTAGPGARIKTIAKVDARPSARRSADPAAVALYRAAARRHRRGGRRRPCGARPCDGRGARREATGAVPGDFLHDAARPQASWHRHRLGRARPRRLGLPAAATSPVVPAVAARRRGTPRRADRGRHAVARRPRLRQRILAGWGMGVVLGIPLGMLMGHFHFVRHLLDPYIEFFRFIPPIAFVTLAVIWLGPGEGSKISLILYTTVFIVTLNTIAGVHAVSELRLRAAASLGAGPMKTLLTVVVPSTVPYMVTGARIAMGNSFLTIVSAEIVAAQRGPRLADLDRAQLRPHRMGLRRDHHARPAGLPLRPRPARLRSTRPAPLRRLGVRRRGGRHFFLAGALRGFDPRRPHRLPIRRRARRRRRRDRASIPAMLGDQHQPDRPVAFAETARDRDRRDGA